MQKGESEGKLHIANLLLERVRQSETQGESEGECELAPPEDETE